MDEILIRRIVQEEFKRLLTSQTLNIQVNTQFLDGRNIQIGKTTGSQFGTDSTQKIGFQGATPVVQQAPSGQVGLFIAGSGTAAKSDSTWTGNLGSTYYGVGDIIQALKKLGLLTS